MPRNHWEPRYGSLTFGRRARIIRGSSARMPDQLLPKIERKRGN